MTRLATDTGLVRAESVCIVGEQRVVVGLSSFIVLIDHGQMSILVGLKALCRFDKGILFVVDEDRGLVWAVKGIEKVGPRNNDEQFAKDLLLEAARILGCKHGSFEYIFEQSGS